MIIRGGIDKPVYLVIVKTRFVLEVIVRLPQTKGFCYPENAFLPAKNCLFNFCNATDLGKIF